jgi:site-specific DNA recombinase
VWRETYSGADMNRPQLREMLKDARARAMRRVVCYSLDRLSRDQTDRVVIMHMLNSSKVQVEVVTEKLDDTPNGRFMLYTLGFFAEIERANILERTARGRRYRAESGGLLPASYPTYGYRFGDAPHLCSRRGGCSSGARDV